MDVFYLAIAYLATLRNWASDAAFRVSRFLYFYRLVGVVAFRASPRRGRCCWSSPTPSSTSSSPTRVCAPAGLPSAWHLPGWIVVAALIWVFVKLPQEYWIHVAQLDLTDTLDDYPWAWPLLISLLLVLAGVLWFVVRAARSPDSDLAPRRRTRCPRRWTPPPSSGPDGATVAVWSSATAEKMVLVGCSR